MKIRIHRGANQIGGCITEIQSDSGTRILIDLGHNLPCEPEQKDEFDDPVNLSALLDGISGIIYTHNHGDHLGFFDQVPSDVPQYIGEMAREVMFNLLDESLNKAIRAKRKPLIEEIVGKVLKLNSFCIYATGQIFRVGDISITPYLVSHSAADAYMLLIECDGRRVLHTGDLREHGFLGKGLEPTLRHYIKNVDVLIVEGTMLSRDDEQTKSEADIKRDMVNLMHRYKNVFVLCSSTNFDRLAGLHKANALFSRRPFVCDIYQRTQFETLSKFAAKHSSLYKIEDAEVMSLKNTYLHSRMYDNGFTMVVRDNPTFRKWVSMLMPQLNPEETVLIYSQYIGYLIEQQKLQEFVKQFGGNVAYVHTSGHATRKTLEMICNVLNPSTAIIPIHMDACSDFMSLDISDDLKDKVVVSDVVRGGVSIRVD